MANKPEYNYKSLQTEYGKMPPQAVDLEEAILGSLMLEKDAFITVSDFLKPECFYKEAHQKIYRGIQNLSLNNEPVDILTVSEEMKRLGELEEIGGYYYLAQLTSKVASAAHIEFHARIVVQKYIQRELIRVCTDIQNKAYDEATDVADLVDMAQKQVFEIAEGNLEGNPVAAKRAFDHAGEVLGEAIASMNAVVDGIVVIGGGIIAAHKYLMPAVMRELNGTLEMYEGAPADGMEMKAFFLDDPVDCAAFLAPTSRCIVVPGTTETVEYDPVKRMGVITTKLGTSRAIAFGAYAFALNELDK